MMDNKKQEKHTVIVKLDQNFYKESKKNAEQSQRPFSQYVIDALIQHNKKYGNKNA